MAAKQPTDRKPKSKGKGVDRFSFTHEGVEHTLSRTVDVVTPGWLRANRRRDDIDAFFTMLEELADEDALAAVDSMSRDEFGDLQKAFYEHLGSDMGGSEPSST